MYIVEKEVENSSFLTKQKWLSIRLNGWFFISLFTKEGETATQQQDLYHILMSSTFFVAVDRFHDYVSLVFANQTKNNILNTSKDNKIKLEM